MASTKNPNPSQNSSCDRISKLPDSILHQILSFLPTKEAARTSILSKHWQFLWTWLPNLDLDHRQISADYASFELIALQIMRPRRCSSITKLKLFCIFEDDHDDWDSVSPRPILSEAVSRNVEELDFSMCNGLGNMDSIPSFNLSIFSCETLVVLKFCVRFLLMLDSGAMLPNVRVLHLRKVLYEDDDSIGNLLSRCPVLEELYIEKCCLDEDEDYYDCDYQVSSRTLRDLVLRDYCTCSGSQMSYVDAPALEYVSIEVPIRHSEPSEPTVGLHLENMDNLKSAVIKLSGDGDAQIDWGELMAIFQALYAVSYLEFTCDTACKASEYYIASSLKFPRFDSLVELKLKGFCCFWPMLFPMLHDCPVLQNLTYKTYEFIETPCECDESHPWMPPQRVPDCLLSHLTTFKYKGLASTELELQFIKYIMKNSTVLRNMTIQYCADLIDEQDLVDLEEFFRSERGSARCQLHFSIYNYV